MSVTLDLSLSPTDMIYRLLTLSTSKIPSGYSLSNADLTLANVVAVAGREDGHNTSMLVTPVPASSVVYGPAKTAYYTRKSLRQVLIDQGLSLAITDDLNNWTASTAPASILALLQSGLSSFITAADIVVTPPVTNQDSTVSVVVTMAASHLTIVGATTFVITSEGNRVSTNDIPGSLSGLS